MMRYCRNLNDSYEARQGYTCKVVHACPECDEYLQVKKTGVYVPKYLPREQRAVIDVYLPCKKHPLAGIAVYKVIDDYTQEGSDEE